MRELRSYEVTFTLGAIARRAKEALPVLLAAARAPKPWLKLSVKRVKCVGCAHLNGGNCSPCPPEKGYCIMIIAAKSNDSARRSDLAVCLAAKPETLTKMTGFKLGYDDSTSWEQDLTKALKERDSAQYEYLPFLGDVQVWDGVTWMPLLEHIKGSGHKSNGRKQEGGATRKKQRH